MLRAPIWSMSAYWLTISTSSMFITSVTTGRPKRSRALASSLRPSSPRPRKAYGEVRGLKAPPRRMCPPASATAPAASISCPSLSTEQGPAITANSESPISTAPTFTTVGSGWNSRPTSLKGLLTGTASTTPGIEMIASRRLMGLEPRTPIATLSSPGSFTGRKPRSSTAAQTASTSSAGAWARIRISTGRALLGQHQSHASLAHLRRLGVDRGPQDRPRVEPVLPLFDAPALGDHAARLLPLDEALLVDL